MPDTAEPAEDRQAKADSAGTHGASALVIARGAAAGLLAAAATEAGCGEVVIVPSDSVALVRLLRASAPPRFVLADTGGIGGSFVPLLRTMADPDLAVPLLLRLDSLKQRRALGVAHHLGLTAAVVSVDSGVAELAASLAGLREASPSVPADALTAEALTSAIVARNIVTRYQPQVRLADAEPLALEALARWEHPVRGLLGAAEFVPLAEGAGLGLSLIHI